MKAITLEEIDKYISQEQGQDESAFLKPASAYADEVILFFHDRKEHHTNRLPWVKCEGKFNLRKGEVTCWLGYNGHGKSLILGQISNHLMEIGHKVCIASMEMKPYSTMARMCRQAFGVTQPTIELIRRYHTWTDNRLWIYDQSGSTPAKRIVNLCKYAASIGIEHIVIDSLMKVVSKEDDYNGQKEFVDSLCVLARDTGLHIHLVHHSRKREDETKRPGKMDAKGSGAISDLVDNAVSVWRDKNAASGEFEAFLTVDKQRHGEWEGMIGLFFINEAMSYTENPLKIHRILNIGVQIEEEEF